MRDALDGQISGDHEVMVTQNLNTVSFERDVRVCLDVEKVRGPEVCVRE